MEWGNSNKVSAKRYMSQSISISVWYKRSQPHITLQMPHTQSSIHNPTYKVPEGHSVCWYLCFLFNQQPCKDLENKVCGHTYTHIPINDLNH